uniref:hypothetical protein n=1 Tax=Prevotella sp. TaxID=59823 RepID=UPI004029981E
MTFLPRASRKGKKEASREGTAGERRLTASGCSGRLRALYSHSRRAISFSPRHSVRLMVLCSLL